MTPLHRAIPAALLILVILPGVCLGKGALNAPRMEPEKARELLNQENVSFIDVRRDKNFTDSEHVIPGSVREEPGEVGSWADKYPEGNTFIIYCD